MEIDKISKLIKKLRKEKKINSRRVRKPYRSIRESRI